MPSTYKYEDSCLNSNNFACVCTDLNDAETCSIDPLNSNEVWYECVSSNDFCTILSDGSTWVLADECKQHNSPTCTC